jgi:hypothetical protein
MALFPHMEITLIIYGEKGQDLTSEFAFGLRAIFLLILQYIKISEQS